MYLYGLGQEQLPECTVPGQTNCIASLPPIQGGGFFDLIWNGLLGGPNASTITKVFNATALLLGTYVVYKVVVDRRKHGDLDDENAPRYAGGTRGSK